jgi:protein-disulfide isomerase
MHDQLFASQQTLTDWNAHAAVIRIGATKFANCVASDKYADEVRKDLALTQRIGVQGTPGFYFAPSSGAKITTSSYLGGARPFPAFKEQIDALLKQQAAKNGTRQAQGGD